MTDVPGSFCTFSAPDLDSAILQEAVIPFCGNDIYRNAFFNGQIGNKLVMRSFQEARSKNPLKSSGRK